MSGAWGYGGRLAHVMGYHGLQWLGLRVWRLSVHINRGAGLLSVSLHWRTP